MGKQKIMALKEQNMEDRGSRLHTNLPLIFLILIISGFRLWLEIYYINQPLFEGYVGRQIPTAMVSRSITAGQSFFYPELQTGPFPSFFLVEPPIYAGSASLLHQLTDVQPEACGRLVSMAGTVFTTIGLALWCRKLKCSYTSLMIFLAMPVSIRFGRAFQPDSLAIGLVFLGIGIVADQISKKWIFIGWILISLGIATKITLLPFVLIALKSDKPDRYAFLKKISLLVSISIPAMLWYGWVFYLKTSSRQMATGQAIDSMKLWWQMLGPLGLLDASRLWLITLNIIRHAWTPLFCPIMIAVVILRPGLNRLYAGLFSAMIWFLLVGSKSHHIYYWLTPSPVIALLISEIYRTVASRNRSVAFIMLGGFIAGGFFQSRSTWQTPAEWQPLTQDISQFKTIIESVPGEFLVAHEAVIYAMGQKGFRWEWPAEAQQRAVSAWGIELAGASPGALLEFYKSQGGRWFLALDTDPEWQKYGAGQLPGMIDTDRLVLSHNGLLLYDIGKNGPEKRR